MLKRILAGLVVAVLMVDDGAVAEPLEDATAADQRGDYGTVLKLLTPLAEQGNAVAQARLGLLYEEGRLGGRDPRLQVGDQEQGVPQDTEAVKWYRRSADQGNASAQIILGLKYEYGRNGVPEDLVLAYMWLDLAAAQGAKDAAELRDMFALGMAPDQIAEAQRLAREWKPKIKP
jgi:TPR repeat protein